jgi:hypothetical protein
MRIIKLALYTTIINCFVIGMLVVPLYYREINIAESIGSVIYTFGNIVIPITVATILYVWLNTKVMSTNFNGKIVLMMLILMLMFSAGLITWILLEVAIFYHTLSLEKINTVFEGEFLIFSPLVISTAIVLPLLGRRMQSGIHNVAASAD